MSSDDNVEDPRIALRQQNEDRIKELEVRGDEIQRDLARKDLSEAVSNALLEEYDGLWEEYHDLKADQVYLQGLVDLQGAA